MSVSIASAAVLTSRLVGKVGIRVPLLVGPVLAIFGLLLLTRLTPSSDYGDVIGPLVIIAIGMGLVFVPLTLTAVSGVRGDETGLASALLNTCQQIGGALGLAVLATIAIDATKSKLRSLTPVHGYSSPHAAAHATAIATVHGYTTAFAVGAGVAFLALLISLLVIRTPPKTPTEPQPPSTAGAPGRPESVTGLRVRVR